MKTTPSEASQRRLEHADKKEDKPRHHCATDQTSRCYLLLITWRSLSPNLIQTCKQSSAALSKKKKQHPATKLRKIAQTPEAAESNTSAQPPDIHRVSCFSLFSRWVLTSTSIKHLRGFFKPWDDERGKTLKLITYSVWIRQLDSCCHNPWIEIGLLSSV